MASPLSHYLPIRRIYVDGVEMLGVANLDVDSATLTATISEDGKTLHLESVGGGGGPDLADAAPPAIAAAGSVGVSTDAAREDHTHAHGSQSGGSLHALADGTTAGFVSPAHYAILAAIAAGTYTATFGDVEVQELVANGVCSLADVGCDDLTAATIRSNDISATSGTCTVGGSGISALVLGRSAATAQIVCSTLYEQADQVYRRTTSGANRRVDVVSTAYSQTYDSSVTSVTDSWSQASSGAGGTRIISGQQGASGQVGGNIEIIPGAGGTPGTNLAGLVIVRLGQPVSNTTATMQFWDNSAEFLRIGRENGPTAKINAAGSYQVQAGTTIWQIAASDLVFRGTTTFFDQGTCRWRTNGAVTKRIDTVGDAFAMTYDAAVTSVTEAFGAAATTRETTWTSGTAAARVSERHATVTTTDATVTTCGTVTITNDRVQVVTAIVVGYQNNTTVAGYEVKAVFRAASGTATRVAAPTVVVLGEDSAGWDVTMDASGATARVRVTGAAATTITWETYFTVHYGKAA